MNYDIIIGQRWISDTELQMGLGTVLAVDHRTVTVVFLATGETRVYAKQTAPLTRVRFTRGDSISSYEGWNLTVESVSEQDGLITYHGVQEDGEQADLPEGQLNNFIQLSQPADRLFSGQIDQNKWFELRYETLQQANRLAHTSLYGLTGTRTSLIPHQLFIAHEVASRFAPRVLLADEVGLGKTIEAGMIVHQQLLTERAQRVLIIVPETLLHQWLVEMLRRFNLRFSIFDDERCQSLEDENPQQTPFLSEQLVLCSLEFMVKRPERIQQALAATWDLLVVDEAHHLQWSPQQVSLEYECIESLAEETKGVLLLTATPEQLGKSGHFARLRLLDRDRFPNLELFLAEEKTYQPVAEAIDELINLRSLSEKSFQALSEALKESDNRHSLDILDKHDADETEKTSARNFLIQHLLDRHGTGRLLFRNTRAAVKGFPERRVNACPLPLPDQYASNFDAIYSVSDNPIKSVALSNPQSLLSPESLYKINATNIPVEWTSFDPRISWLKSLLSDLKPEKVLVITANADTALDIVKALRAKTGIHAAVFNESMSIIERDRAAAFFADQEIGSQVLICSEIGSEGRNFQFAHHLVLFDLPLNPDLLEQRIGRLDRIGQTQTINIHIPYLENSTQTVMFHWYQEGLNAFEHTCPAGHDVFIQVNTNLLNVLHQRTPASSVISELIDSTRALYEQLNEELHRGRDRLLEYNSCLPEIANKITHQAQHEDSAHNPAHYLNQLFDCFDIELDEHSEHCFILHAGNQPQAQAFPGLPDEGMTITFERATALVYEDVHFLSWEHPMVTDAMDMILSQEQGNTALTSIQHKGLLPGTLLLECLYVLTSAANAELQIDRYLPPTSLRILVDQTGKNLSKILSPKDIKLTAEAVSEDIAHKVIRNQEATIRQMITSTGEMAQQQTPAILESASRYGQDILFEEINRLRELREVNPNIRDEEIVFFETQWAQLNKSLNSASPRLDAVRVIVVT